MRCTLSGRDGPWMSELSRGAVVLADDRGSSEPIDPIFPGSFDGAGLAHGSTPDLVDDHRGTVDVVA